MQGGHEMGQLVFVEGGHGFATSLALFCASVFVVAARLARVVFENGLNQPETRKTFHILHDMFDYPYITIPPPAPLLSM